MFTIKTTQSLLKRSLCNYDHQFPVPSNQFYCIFVFRCRY